MRPVALRPSTACPVPTANNDPISHATVTIPTQQTGIWPVPITALPTPSHIAKARGGHPGRGPPPGWVDSMAETKRTPVAAVQERSGLVE